MEKETKRQEVTSVEDLKNILLAKGERISKAKRVKSLLEKQKGFIKKKQSLTDFEEPVLDLHTRDGKILTYEKATAGKFVFDHSSGKPRFLELRPSDQEKRDYAGRTVRWYTAHEDRPFAGWDNPIVDSESVALGYDKTKATDLKYQERIESLKNKGKMTWVYIVIGIAIAIAIIGFTYMSWIAPAIREDAMNKAKIASETSVPVAGMILMFIRSKLYKQ